MNLVSLGCLIALPAVAAVGDASFHDSHVVKVAKGKYGPRGMPGDLIELKDGRLLLCYTQDGIVGRTSADGGATWGEPFALVPNPKPPARKGYYCHPSFLRLPEGDILLSYIYATYPTVPYFGHNYYRRSFDEGRTWTDQFVLSPQPGYCIIHNNKLRRLSTGRIIAPAEFKKRWPGEQDHSGYVALTFYSDDEGYSWQRSRNDVDMDPAEAQEPHVVELNDGRLMMLFRTYSGCVGRSYSKDGGATWSPGELVKELPLPANSSALTVDRIPATGDLLLIRCTAGTEGRRTPLVSMISTDEGATWGHARTIAGDPEDDYGYQSVTFVRDRVLVSYHARDGLHVARIGVDWFYVR